MSPLPSRQHPRLAPGLLSRSGYGWALAALAVLAMAFGGCDCSGGSTTMPTPLPPLDSIRVIPGTDTIRVGAQRTFSVNAYDTLGVLIPDAKPYWESENTDIFTVTSSGVVRGIGEGWAHLIASGGGVADSAIVSVFPDTGWYAQVSNTSNILNGVFFQPDGRTGFAVGNAGTIRATANAGVTWEFRLSSVSFSLNAVHFADPTFGWASGAGGTVLRTTDGGASWVRQNTPVSETLYDVFALNADSAVTVGSTGTILRTGDGGENWVRVLPTVTTNNIRSVSFDAAGNGWAVCDGGQILGTHDLGDSWYVYQPSVTTQNLVTVWRRTLAQAWAGGPAGTFLITVAGPDSALWQVSGVPNFQIYGVHFADPQVGYAVGFNATAGAGGVARTDDGGLNWDAQTSNTTFRLNDVYFVDALRGWAVGNGGVIIHTARGGKK
jgi:photosystem II stability/assembly factor-like uncharacterized protein